MSKMLIYSSLSIYFHSRVTNFLLAHITFFSAKREAVLQSAHSEETLGAEEKTRDVVWSTLLLYGRHKSCSSDHCHSKVAHRGDHHLTTCDKDLTVFLSSLLPAVTFSRTVYLHR